MRQVEETSLPTAMKELSSLVDEIVLICACVGAASPANMRKFHCLCMDADCPAEAPVSRSEPFCIAPIRPLSLGLHRACQFQLMLWGLLHVMQHLALMYVCMGTQHITKLYVPCTCLPCQLCRMLHQQLCASSHLILRGLTAGADC